MLRDRFRKKIQRSPDKSGSFLEAVDITDQVPQIDDVLAEVDKAIEKAQQLEQRARSQDHCTC